ncbi:hypothetical protein [Chitinophaga pinensis]|uniref:Lipoprotein n=1 Tax=Chitinophaga pinensis (strain ATCC 43595 / DSM 2588 / LMG 13176 / NBRC 15968 / NCIMB 11800 / UQM 2034) TaxID=485918 RepID=A0A979G2V1_CHIPD|nr:hypothetical protein [Chitinophaga pinensis]ACU59648.1 hypothetical protein Cpin_2156 [Chitinophaga pinensis DSM 2588]
MKQLALCLLAVALLLTACGKDEDENQSPANSFTYNGQETGTPYGYIMDWGSEGSQLMFADKELTLDGLSTNASAVGIDLDVLVSGQTYTFKKSDAPDYDKKQHFGYAAVYNNQPFANGKFVANAQVLDSLIAGSVTFRQVDNVYNIVYDLKYVNTTVKGEYNGELTPN